jgi:chromosome segregation ATPase
MRFGLLILAFGTLIGCETGRNYQGDIDSLNSKIMSLQGQLTVKDEEIAKLRASDVQLSQKDKEITDLQSQLSQQRQAADRLESERKTLSDKLDAARAKAARQEKSKNNMSDLK